MDSFVSTRWCKMFSRIAISTGPIGRQLNVNVRPQFLALAPNRGCSKDVTKEPPKAVVAESHIKKAHRLYNGPDRDYKNFPKSKMREEAPPTQFGFIPDSFFKAFYDKTGVTGPYLFGAGLVTFLLSKEIWVVDHGFTEFLSFWTAVYIVHRKFGKQIGEFLDKRAAERAEKVYFRPIREAKRGHEELIKYAEEDIARQDAQKLLFDAKRENVHLQLEAVYRKRLAEVHDAVKKRLDYQLDVQQTKRRFEQEHMVNWIISNVMKSISPEQEKQSVTKCISDLKTLATNAA